MDKMVCSLFWSCQTLWRQPWTVCLCVCSCAHTNGYSLAVQVFGVAVCRRHIDDGRCLKTKFCFVAQHRNSKLFTGHINSIYCILWIEYELWCSEGGIQIDTVLISCYFVVVFVWASKNIFKSKIKMWLKTFAWCAVGRMRKTSSIRREFR